MFMDRIVILVLATESPQAISSWTSWHRQNESHSMKLRLLAQHGQGN